MDLSILIPSRNEQFSEWSGQGESPDATQICDLVFASRTLDFVTPQNGDKIGGTLLSACPSSAVAKRDTRIELVPTPWKGVVLPLYESRVSYGGWRKLR